MRALNTGEKACVVKKPQVRLKAGHARSFFKKFSFLFATFCPNRGAIYIGAIAKPIMNLSKGGCSKYSVIGWSDKETPDLNITV